MPKRLQAMLERCHGEDQKAQGTDPEHSPLVQRPGGDTSGSQVGAAGYESRDVSSASTRRIFAKYLYTTSMPDPDLLIRTSGEMRLSNFLLWQMAYTEIYVTETLWPDFRTRGLRRGA